MVPVQCRARSFVRTTLLHAIVGALKARKHFQLTRYQVSPRINVTLVFSLIAAYLRGVMHCSPFQRPGKTLSETCGRLELRMII